MSTISVVIPTYNRATLLPEAIESALGQSYAPVEIIVVDDGSKDDTEAVVRRFGAAVLYVSQPNAGVGVARNTGAGRASGRWIAFLDSDDAWERDKLALQLAALRAAPNAAWSVTDLRPSWTVRAGLEDPPWSPLVFRYLKDGRHRAGPLRPAARTARGDVGLIASVFAEISTAPVPRESGTAFLT
jgi:glycosyltransferase involved in cell wall biosynthesis